VQHLSGPTHARRDAQWWAPWRRYRCWCGLHRCPDLVERRREQLRQELIKHWDERQI
jgi:hypothetical protein